MKKLNAKGLSLIELIIAISMSSVVVGAAALFLYNSQRSYRNAQYAINLQKDSQLIMERLSDFIMEANYIRVEDYGPNASQALIIYKACREQMDLRSAEHTMNTKATKRIILFVDDDNRLRYQEDDDETGKFNQDALSVSWHVNDSGVIKEEPDIEGYRRIYVVMADGVESFRVTKENGDPITFDPANPTTSVRIQLRMEMGRTSMKDRQEYTVSDSFSLRNQTLDKILPLPETASGDGGGEGAGGDGGGEGAGGDGGGADAGGA